MDTLHEGLFGFLHAIPSVNQQVFIGVKIHFEQKLARRMKLTLSTMRFFSVTFAVFETIKTKIMCVHCELMTATHLRTVAKR
jgi:hypothetical protein